MWSAWMPTIVPVLTALMLTGMAVPQGEDFALDPSLFGWRIVIPHSGPGISDLNLGFVLPESLTVDRRSFAGLLTAVDLPDPALV